MAKSDALDRKLAALRATPTHAELRDALRSSTGLLVAAAATRIAAQADAPALALVAELGAAFDRLCESPVKRDPGCRGKLALLEALYALDRWDDAFERAARYRQPEPQWGGSVDTAAAVRGLAGLAYAHCARPDALDVLAELLADPERTTRATAAQGLGNAGRIDATALLRFKLLAGDEEPVVLAACFESLLALGRDAAIEFVARLAAGADARAEAAVLALGGSHAPAAHAHIAAWCDRAPPEPRRRVGYLALALLRHEPATAELLAIVSGDAPQDALAAARALATFRDDPTLRARLVAAAEAQRDRAARAEIVAGLR